MRAIQLSKVAIVRDASRIVKDVNAHEVPILRDIHTMGGSDEGLFEVIEEDSGYVVSSITNSEEMDRLRLVYGKKPETLQILKSNYRTVTELGDAIGDREPPRKRKPRAQDPQDQPADTGEKAPETGVTAAE